MADEPGHEVDVDLRDRNVADRGAFVMGRNMFGPVRGEWDPDWRGWWGSEPPYHAPTFVLTHYPRDSIEMQGGTTFDRDVDIAGGASTVRQAFASALIDELTLDIVPVLLGRGERLFDGVADPGLEPVEVVHSPWATHVRYRVGP